MDIIKSLILGIIQGISEPLPISSSGHVTLFKEIFNTEIFDSLDFEIITNFGSFLAILFIFRKDIIDLVKSFFTYISKKDTKQENKNKFTYCIYLIISTIPTIITGLFLEDYINYPVQVLAIMFVVTAIMLFIVRKHKGTKNDADITLKDAVIIGLFQSIAILPGISRSGAVLVACLLCNLKRDTALKYTFILYFPVSVGAMILKLNTLDISLMIPYLTGAFAAMIVTYFSYQWLSSWVKKGKLIYFAYYCIALSIFILIYFR